MNGLKYLLDTNFVLGLMKREPAVIKLIEADEILAAECAYSAVTRMELLGYPGITDEEARAVQSRLAKMVYLPISSAIEDAAISLRQLRKVKLPDALIAATAACHGLKLLTLDSGLQAISQLKPTSC
jgi:predicted nucleic acid-binding protein